MTAGRKPHDDPLIAFGRAQGRADDGLRGVLLMREALARAAGDDVRERLLDDAERWLHSEGSRLRLALDDLERSLDSSR